MRHAIIGLACAFACSAAGAQVTVPASYVGQWKAQWTAPNGQARNGSLELKEDGKGSWQVFLSPRQSNVCNRQPTPVVVESATPEEIAVVLRGKDVLESCDNARVTLKPANDGALTGTWRDGRTLTLTK